MCDVMENQHPNLALGGVRHYRIWRTKIVTVIRTEARLQYFGVVVGGGHEDRGDGETAIQLLVYLFVC
jgi:hypothetical protein